MGSIPTKATPAVREFDFLRWYAVIKNTFEHFRHFRDLSISVDPELSVGLNEATDENG